MYLVLVVDDDFDIRESMRLLLEEEGYRVQTAADGVEALAAMAAELPSLVILDLMMPVMNGWEVAGHMQDEGRLASIPMCVVTATPEWAPLDAHCVLRKPVDIGVLLRVVREHCQAQTS